MVRKRITPLQGYVNETVLLWTSCRNDNETWVMISNIQMLKAYQVEKWCDHMYSSIVALEL